jgi:hypothetical protein
MECCGGIKECAKTVSGLTSAHFLGVEYNPPYLLRSTVSVCHTTSSLNLEHDSSTRHCRPNAYLKAFKIGNSSNNPSHYVCRV